LTDVVLALDQGTSGTRCFVVDVGLTVLASAARPVASSFPSPGWVEQDPEEIFRSAVHTMREAVDRSGVKWSDVRGIGIDNQTETFVVWDRATGRPVYPAIVWQCRRTAEACDRLRSLGHEPLIRERTGLELDPSFSATKLAWILDNVEGARRAAESGNLAFGDVACWLIWRLSGGTAHVTEPSNASRSMLLRLADLKWDDDLLELFGIPRSLLPEIQSSGSVFATTRPDVIDAEVPIAGVLGDQQAALFGQQCWDQGEAKVTLGTGAFIWVNAGPNAPSPPEGILATCAWRLDPDVAYAFEGFVPVAGSVVTWLVETGVLSDPNASESLIRTLEDREQGDVWFVPALTGLGAPVWDAYAKGTILGLTRATTPAHLVRAAMDGVVHQVVDAVEAMDAGVEGGLGLLRVDGGMSRNDWIMQRLANLAARPVDRPINPEATGIGAACVAGLTVGLWSSHEELRDRWTLERRFEPDMPVGERANLRERWASAVEAARSWG
jgi:glycerol kinase